MYSEVANSAFEANIHNLFLKILSDKNPNKNIEEIENNHGKNRKAISLGPKIL